MAISHCCQVRNQEGRYASYSSQILNCKYLAVEQKIVMTAYSQLFIPPAVDSRHFAEMSAIEMIAEW